MCSLCLRDDIFGGRNPTTQDLVRERAKKVKAILASADGENLCYVGDAAVELLRREQYDLAKQL